MELDYREIIIKETTEKVKISELNQREKQIFDYAYLDGVTDGKGKRGASISIIALCLVLICVALFVSKCNC